MSGLSFVVRSLWLKSFVPRLKTDHLPLRSFNFIRLIVFVVLSFSGQFVFAQKWLEAPPLSEQQITHTKGMDEYSGEMSGEAPEKIDTTLLKIHFYDPVDRNGAQYRNTGNLGSAHFRLVCCDDETAGLQIGLRQFDLYKFSKDDIPFYRNTRIYTLLKLIIGQKIEQAIEVTHSQAIKKKFVFGFHYKRFGSDGFYQNRQNRHNDFVVTGTYDSKKKYLLNGAFIFNNIKAPENGGVISENIFSRDTSFQSKELLDVRLTEAQNQYRDISGHIYQSWSFGKISREMPVDTSVSISDSAKTQNDSVFLPPSLPRWQIYNELDVGVEKYNYTDGSPDSAYYGAFFIADSIKEDYSNTIKKNFYGGKVGFRKFLTNRSRLKGVVLDVGSSYFFNMLSQDGFRDEQLHNLDVIASLYKASVDSNSRTNFGVSGKYGFLDYNQNDFSVKGFFEYDFRKFGLLRVDAALARFQPDWIYSRFAFNNISWDLDLNKTTILSLSLFYRLPKYNFHTGVRFFQINNLAFWSQTKLPAQTSASEQVWVFELRKLFRLKHFGFDNLIRVQLLSDDAFMRYPLYWSVHSLFYERYVFKKKLLLKIGLDIRYNTNYKANGYFPVTGGFYLQDNATLSFYPVMDVYLSFQVRTVRLFFTEYHVNQGMFGDKGYFAAYKYPANDRHFRFGVLWIFLD